MFYILELFYIDVTGNRWIFSIIRKLAGIIRIINLLSVLESHPDWTVERIEGRQVLYYRGKNYIPKDEELRRDIAQMFHDHPTAGHPGELETYNSIRQHYWWPGLRTYVKNYVQGCGTCQQF